MAEDKKFVPFVSASESMPEFTAKALIIGLFLAVILGAANAYLGLKAGMTIAATYPAAVIGMAVLKIFKGSILEENFTRTVGSIGESVAAGAVFTLPAFFIAGIWPEFGNADNFIVSVLIMVTGGVLGIMFVALLRRVMVEDKDLPFPESLAAAEIHKTGRSGGGGSKFLFWAMGLGALIKTLGELKIFAFTWEKFVAFKEAAIAPGLIGTKIKAAGGMLLSSPGVKPAYVGVGYIIGPRLAALNFSGGVIAWGLLTPMIMFFIAPYLDIEAIKNFVIALDLGLNGDAANSFMASKDSIVQTLMANNTGITMEAAQAKATAILAGSEDKAWTQIAYHIWINIVKPIAIGGMLVGTAYTLWNMRKSLIAGIKRSVGDVKKAATGEATTERTDKDLKFTTIIIGMLAAGVATFLITFLIFKTTIIVALIATVVMVIAGFFFGAVSGYLVGIIGSSNNPISGLTISTVVVTALLMLILGAHGPDGIAATLGVAAIVCVAAAVAGEMLQDLKAGHILGGTPWRMQVGDIIGVIIASAVMFIPLMILHEGDVAKGALEGYVGGFGSKELSAPQAGLMSMLTKGIIGGDMAWPLIVAGMLMGVGFILMRIKSPMLVSIGMYLPLETTFAIFIGGLIKGIIERFQEARKLNELQKNRVGNIGILLASGLIAGEALIGLLFAALAFFEVPLWAFPYPSYLTSLVVFLVLAYVLVQIPLKKAGNPLE